MNQNIWGPHMWFSLHTITFDYPINPSESDKENMNNFLITMQYVIPCSVCQKNYKRHLCEKPPNKYLNNRSEFVYWMIDLHNIVNAETGKKIVNYDTVLNRYEKIYQKKIELNNIRKYQQQPYWNNREKIILYYFFFTIIILIIIFIFKFIK